MIVSSLDPLYHHGSHFMPATTRFLDRFIPTWRPISVHDSITVLENGRSLTFDFEHVIAYHGGGLPGGVVYGLKAMQAAFPLLSETPPERREISVLTAFSGPGGRDAIEIATRALTDGRLTIDRSIGGADVISQPPVPMCSVSRTAAGRPRPRSSPATCARNSSRWAPRRRGHPTSWRVSRN